MRMSVATLVPALALAVGPTLVSERPVGIADGRFYSPGGLYSAVVEYGAGNTEFVPFGRFDLLDQDGKVVYSKDGIQHTVMDISDNGLVVGADFDGPVSGRARLHFYDRQGQERGSTDIGFWGQRRFSADGSVYCVLSGSQGLRVFVSTGRELYNAGPGNRFAVSADGRHVALATDTEIRLLRDGEVIASIPLATPFVRDMAFSPDGRRIGYCERRGLAAHRTQDGVCEYRYEPDDKGMRFISLDLGNRFAVCGLDFDAGRGTPGRHRRGSVVLLNAAGLVVWQEELAYNRWYFAVPKVRFGPAGMLSVRTAEAVREYRYEEQ